MRKKYLSALLFGALLVTSTGTFTSCKDYDDDINNLQEQITSNKDAIAALQKLVSEGKWVTSISPIENGFTVTMSDGTTQNITGINGADGQDGKPGTVITLDPETNNWIIDGVDTGVCAKGEKGDQGEQGAQGPAGENGQDGAQGDQGAQGPAGEPGKNAPSPSIDPETGCWVVYEWDATAGDYKAVTTDINAESTKVFVVESEGFITLNVDGKEYKLPTICDAFNVEALAAVVDVYFESAEWSEWNANKDASKILLKAYPELAKISKDSIVKQGGKLPLIVSPGNVELDDKYTFEHVEIKGETPNIKIGNPVKGLPSNLESDGWTVESRSIDASSCLWTLDVEPAYNEKDEGYEESKEYSSLLVENSNGTVVRTAYSYKVKAKKLTERNVIKITPSSTLSAKYSETIDVLQKPEDGDAMFALKNAYNGYVVLEATNPVQVEKYRISIDGTKLTIANMPANETSIDVTLKLTALGLNGSTDSEEATFTISQGVEATGELHDQSVTLNVDRTKAQVRWNLADLKFSAVQLDNFLKGDETITVTREKDDLKYVAYNEPVIYYNAQGKETTYNEGKASWNNGTAVTFGFNVNGKSLGSALEGYIPEQFTESEYKVTLKSTSGSTVIYSAEAKLAVNNPNVADILKLNPALVENGALLVTALPTGSSVKYDFADGIQIADTYKDALGTPVFTDMDYKTFVDNGGDTSTSTDFANFDWAKNGNLLINRWISGNNVPASQQHMYKVRNIRAEYPLFNNDNNKIVFDFEVIVKSQVYSEDPTKVITFDDSKLVAVYGDADNNKVDVKSAVKSAVFALGSDKGKSYNLFASNGSEIKATGYAYGSIGDDMVTTVTEGTGTKTYVLDANNMLISLAVEDMKKLGYFGDDILAAQTGTKKFYLTKENYYDLWDDISTKPYFEKVNDNNVDYYVLNDAALDDADKASADANYNRFIKYAKQIAFDKKDNIVIGHNQPTEADYRISKVALKVVDKSFAEKFITDITKFDGTLNVNDLNGNATTTIQVKNMLEEGVAETVTVEMQLVVTDIWNKTMYVPFNVTIKTVK